MNRKGVTPIIGVILLLMITVAITGATYSWISATQGSIQRSTEERIRQTSEKIGADFTIHTLSCEEGENYDLIRARIGNTGSSKIEEGTEILSKIRHDDMTLGNKLIILENGIPTGEISDTLVFNFSSNPTDYTNEEHKVTLTIGTVIKGQIVNCTG